MATKKKRAGKRHRARDGRKKRSSFGRTLPRSPARIEALLERCTRVKRMLVEYLRARCWNDICERAAGYRDTDDPEASLTNATEDVLHGWPGDQPHIIDMFVADQPALNAADRRMVRRWKDARRGVFRVDRRKERHLRTRNLVDELDYQVLIGGPAPDGFESFAPGAFLSTVIVPLMNAWTFSGMQTIYKATDARSAYGLAAKLARRRPADFFRNPEHLERSREAGRLQHERFVNFFRQSWVVGTAQEIEDLHNEMVAENNRLAAAQADPPSAGEIAAGNRIPPMELPSDLRSAESVGMLSHPEEGLFFLPHFRRFLESFAEPSRAGEVENRRVVLGYLENDSIPPAAFELVAGAEPDKASETMRTVLGEPTFDWRRDADRLLRKHKPSHFERPPLPTVLALSTEMAAGLRFVDRLETKRGRSPLGSA